MNKMADNLDYEKLGFKCGLEIHRQLETRKLFCKCPSLVHDYGEPDFIVKRRLKASAGETGEIDAAAIFEEKKGKEFIYEGKNTSSCLIELDEEPPIGPDKDAMMTALEIIMLLNAKPVDEVVFMRKTVIDGSNVSGFQRTALIATNGHVDTSLGKVPVPTICLEEEAAQKVEDGKDFVKYRLDRLGVALIEIATDASIKNPEHAKETAEIIGKILKSTGKVKTGIGTIRQDVNVSISGRPRVEIKGFQELKSIPLVVETEVKRQMSHSSMKAEVRKANQDGTTTFLRPMPGSARMYPETDIKPIKITKDMLDSITLPELLDEKSLRFQKQYSLSADLANQVVNLNPFLFEELASQLKNVDRNLIANVLVTYPKEIRRKHNLQSDNLTEENFRQVLSKVNNNEIPKEAVLEILTECALGKKPDFSKYVMIDDKEIESEIKAIIDANPDANINALMGDAMKKLRGKADGKKVMDLLKKYVK